ncbi:hypothetical protein [Corynebacterium amycolatum]|uniref:hypothetical protein n=1 Tax=Corynebacterium amycolatum TaxID=43765 RepID=UPI001CD6E33E|nr:hypothetical protein [Corynebacterium amycolatum]
MSQTVELPPQPSAWQLFTAFHSRAQRWPGALRAALALFLPGAVALLTGHGSEMLLIAAGGCVVIYGEGHPYRSRLRVMATAGFIFYCDGLRRHNNGRPPWLQPG